MRDMGSIPGAERSPGGGHGNPLQYSCLENAMHRGAWWATVHRFPKSQKSEATERTHAYYTVLCNFSLDNIMMRIRKVKRLSESGFYKLINSKKKGSIFNSSEKNAFFADAKCTSDQIRSVAQSCLTLCDPMNRSTPGLPVHHQLPEFTQTHVHQVSDAIQPSVFLKIFYLFSCIL